MAKVLVTPTESFTQAYAYERDQDAILLARSGSGQEVLYIDGQGIDEHLAYIDESEAKAFVSDHLGTILNTEMTNKMTGAFGEELFSSPVVSSSSMPVVYGFTGRQLDPESGLYYYRNRTYDPQSGRFMSLDPIGLSSGDTNVYRYVENNPIKYYDPYGWVKLKPGITDSNLSYEVKNIYGRIDEVTNKLSIPEAVITSTNDSRHKQGSLHYVNKAIDIRGNNVTDAQMNAFADELKKILGPDFDVIAEFFPENPINDHIHLEYDPKEKVVPCP